MQTELVECLLQGPIELKVWENLAKWLPSIVRQFRFSVKLSDPSEHMWFCFFISFILNPGPKRHSFEPQILKQKEEEMGKSNVILWTLLSNSLSKLKKLKTKTTSGRRCCFMNLSNSYPALDHPIQLCTQPQPMDHWIMLGLMSAIQGLGRSPETNDSPSYVVEEEIAHSWLANCIAITQPHPKRGCSRFFYCSPSHNFDFILYPHADALLVWTFYEIWSMLTLLLYTCMDFTDQAL